MSEHNRAFETPLDGWRGGVELEAGAPLEGTAWKYYEKCLFYENDFHSVLSVVNFPAHYAKFYDSRPPL